MTITVYGDPGPQGSKRAVGRDGKGRAILVESSKKVKPWRQAIMDAVMVHYAAIPRPLVAGPVSVRMLFSLRRPKKPKANVPDRIPDLSKLVRSTEDALTQCGVWEDDARVVVLVALKRYAGSAEALPVPGVVIEVVPWAGSQAAKEVQR